MIKLPDQLAAGRNTLAAGDCPPDKHQMIETFNMEGLLMQPQNAPASTIADFCTRYGIHRSTFYRNLERGLMPRLIKVGSARRILYEDEQAWLSAQQCAANRHDA